MECVYVCVCVRARGRMCMYVCVHVFVEGRGSQFSFYHVSPRGQTQVPRFDAECLYSLSPLPWSSQLPHPYLIHRDTLGRAKSHTLCWAPVYFFFWDPKHLERSTLTKGVPSVPPVFRGEWVAMVTQ